MAVVCLDGESLDYYKGQVQKLTPEAERKFGKLDVVGMMRHLRNALETAVGDVTLPDESIPIVRTLFYYFACHVMTTWPGGVIKAPDFWTPPADHEFDEEQELFLTALDKFVDEYEADPGRVSANPVLGPLSMRKWSRLMGIHIKHHMRQFSVS